METHNKISGFGRPKLNEFEKKNHIFKLRLTKNEHSELKRRSKEQGYKSISRYINNKLFSNIQNESMPIHQVQIISGVVKEINAVGKNINQGVRKMETMDGEAEKALLYEAMKLQERLEDISSKVDVILEIINKEIIGFGFSPMRNTLLNK